MDQNFPQPIVNALTRFQAHAELVPIWQIDRRMSELDDWELLLALHHHERSWSGLITTDSSMLSQARELATLMKTRLTLVVAMASGHDPVRASGLVFAHLGNIAKRTDPERPQVFRLRAANRPADDPWNDLLRPLADRQGRDAAALYAEASPGEAELARSPLDRPHER